ncbi:MAG: hypothetical protein PVG39_00125 [Desulfobacteraceae bacterium]|jgi:hypothetical protein
MRLDNLTDGRVHPSDGGVNDHHAAPISVDFINTTQSLPPGTSYNLDVSLGRDDFRFARVMIIGPNDSAGLNSPWKECAELLVTRDSTKAMGHSISNAGQKKVYASTYSKQNSDSYLTHKIFNAGVGDYIAVENAVLTGSVLRLTFRSFYGGSMTLNVRGQALLW